LTPPPRLAEWLLARRLERDDRDEIIGDLAEEFRDHLRLVSAGAARRWYWRQTFVLLAARTRQESDRAVARRYRSMSVDDVRFAVRRLWKQPTATVMSVVTLAGAIGAGVATWSMLSALLLRPVPVADPDRVVVVGQRSGASARLSNDNVYTFYDRLRKTDIFEAVAGGGTIGGLPARIGPDVAPVSLYFASANFADVLGLRMQAGRWFSPVEDRRGGNLVAVLSDRYWRRAFEARPSAVGESVIVSGHTVAVIGVAPRGFRGVDVTSAPDLYLPLESIATVVGDRFTNFFDEGSVPQVSSPTAWVRSFGRLKPGMSTIQVVAGLSTLSTTSARPQTPGITDLETASLAEGARPQLREFSRLVAITVGLLVAIGCLAVGMQLLMRTEARREEFAMCLAMGATRMRLFSGVLVEAALLSAAGALLAVPISVWLVATLTSFQLPGGIDLGQLEIGIDSRTFVVAALAGLIATLAMAAVAGGFGFSADVADALRARAGATPRIGRRRTRAVLVIAEVAVALALLTGAGLFARSLTAALRLNPGYDTGRLANAVIAAPARASAPSAAQTYFDDLVSRLVEIPGTRAVSLSTSSGGMSSGGRWWIDGTPRTMPAFLGFTSIDSSYFSTIGLNLKSGRNFTADDAAQSAPVGIVSESFGRFLANGGNPIGHRVQAGGGTRPGQAPTQVDIVGVVPDLITSVRALEPMVMYTPLSQLAPTPLAPRRTVTLHTLSDPTPAMRRAAEVIHGLDTSSPIPTFTTIDQQLAKQMSPQLFGATMFGVLGGIAAVLTLFGVFVLVESMAGLRRREMGVRAALGATSGQLSALVLGEALWLVGAGVACGVLLSWLGTDLIRSFLFRVAPFDGVTMVTVGGGMVLLAIAVSLKPALKAGRFDLATVLRDE
jgi:predicted permease